MMLAQRTLKTLTRAVGVGLHSGRRVELTLRPAAADTGIVFHRIDLPRPVDISVNALAITDTQLASTLSADGVKVRTVEHLMSACAGLGLDNLHVDITAEEVPILDGSAAAFVYLLQSAGIEVQNAPKRFLRVKRPVEVREGALIVTARKPEDDEARSFLHRGIATRAFERKFTLAEHIRVSGADYRDGLLHIDLVREVPEALKPRQIAIGTTSRVEKLDA